MFMHLVDYYYYTQDSTYNDETIQAAIWQASKVGNFMPANQTTTEGNDDQGSPWPKVYSISAWPLTLSETSTDLRPIALRQALRWDAANCGGGLRWQVSVIPAGSRACAHALQIFPTNTGYNYKNTVANGGFFMLAARLARFTGNQTYVDWATKEWDWWSQSKLFGGNSTYQVNDGMTISNNQCPDADHTQWSYNYGLLIGGLAFLYNTTDDTKWLTPLNGLLNRTLEEFFPASMGDKIMVEAACEPYGTCDTNGWTFKSFVMRWLALTAQLVPDTATTIWPYIQASGQGAAGQCDGGSDGITCGFRWNSTTWDGTYGVGQQMSALAAIQANLITVNNLRAPYTAATGGTSPGDPSAGSGSSDANPNESGLYTRTISTGDKAGAGVLTALALIMTLGGAYFLVK
ncbi:hypothetical protein LTR53_010122 [Teratosphaeriaceae sp. CCFEE 6253]|nr:hypothetical protein LTR53_010122 [Teratosphaeriaceae sp. CCFEE 6253]